MSLVNISIVGNLAKPPEPMYFSSGRIKTTLIVAVNSKSKANKNNDSADFYKVEVWGKLAELAAKYLSKGNQVAASGRLILDRWTDKEGKQRITPVVEANQLSLPPRLKVVDANDIPGGDFHPGNPISGELLMEEDQAGISGLDGPSSDVTARVNENIFADQGFDEFEASPPRRGRRKLANA